MRIREEEKMLRIVSINVINTNSSAPYIDYQQSKTYLCLTIVEFLMYKSENVMCQTDCLRRGAQVSESGL